MIISAIVTTALKAGSPQLRVAQGVRPATQGLPAIVFAIVAREDDPLLDGDGGLQNARIQVDAWAESPYDAEVTANEARNLMLGASAFAATTLSGFHDQEDETRLYRVSQDYSIWFERD